MHSFIRRLPLFVILFTACGDGPAGAPPAGPSPDAAVDAGTDGIDAAGGSTRDARSEASPSADAAPPPPSRDAVVSITGGFEDTCAVLASGHVRCWGNAWNYQLGNGSKDQPFQAVEVAGVDDAVEVGIDAIACARRRDGSVWCWGGDSDAPASPIAGVVGATSLAVAGAFGCAVLADQTVACWGQNDDGQLGDGTKTPRPGAARVQGLTGAVRVTAGETFACALLADHTVRCWGANQFGQLGNGTFLGYSTTPVTAAVSDVVALSAAGGYDPYGDKHVISHVCALKGDGSLWCWGDDSTYELGDNGTAPTMCDTNVLCRPTPAQVANVAGTTAVVCSSDTTCLLAADQTFCWGYNGVFNYGDKFSGVPLHVTQFDGAKQIAVGAYHTCLLKPDGSVWCMGDNTAGQQGVPDPIFENMLHRVVGLP